MLNRSKTESFRAPARSTRLILLSAAAAVLAASPARSLAVTWSGAGTTENWTNSFNWVDIAAPDNDFSDNVFFEAPAALRLTSVVNQSFNIHGLRFQYYTGPLDGSPSYTINNANNATMSVADRIRNSLPSLQTINVPIIAQTTLFVDNRPDGDGYGGGGRLVLNGSATVSAGNRIESQPVSGSSIEFNGSVLGGGKFRQNGPGTTVLSGTSDFFGGVEINDGTLRFGVGASLGSRVNALVFNQTGSNAPVLRKTMAGSTVGNVVLQAGSGSLFADADWTVSGTVSGAGNLIKDGASTVTLANSLTYTGSTTIRSGTLAVADGIKLPTTTDVTIALGTGRLSIGGYNAQTIKSLQGFGTTAVDYGTALTVNGGVYGGQVTGGGGLRVEAGTFTLNNTTNDYLGGTAIGAGGSLTVGNASGNATGTREVSVETGGRLAGNGFIGGAVTVAENGLISPNNAQTTGSTGTLTVGSLYLYPTAIVRIDLNGGQAGSTIDQIRGPGTFDVGGGVLQLQTGTNFFPNLGLSATPILRTDTNVLGVFSTVSGVNLTTTASLAVTYTATNVNVQIANPGDPTLDGLVNFNDVMALEPRYVTGTEYTTWVTGDLTGDGLTNITDLKFISDRLTSELTNQQYATLLNANYQEWYDLRTLRGLSVPEPTSLAFIGVAGVMALRRRRA